MHNPDCSELSLWTPSLLSILQWLNYDTFILNFSRSIRICSIGRKQVNFDKNGTKILSKLPPTNYRKLLCTAHFKKYINIPEIMKLYSMRQVKWYIQGFFNTLPISPCMYSVVCLDLLYWVVPWKNWWSWQIESYLLIFNCRFILF